MRLSYLATRHDSKRGRTSVRAELDDLYRDAMRDEPALSRTKSAGRMGSCFRPCLRGFAVVWA